MKAGRYSQESLRQLGVGNDVISSLRVQPGFQVVLYDNGQMRGRGVAKVADDDCLDDDGLYRRVSSLIIAPVRKPAISKAEAEAARAAEVFALDASLDCVELYVEREICDSRRWPDIVKRCKLADSPKMSDGYLAGHVEVGNCTVRNWPALVERIKNPKMR